MTNNRGDIGDSHNCLSLHLLYCLLVRICALCNMKFIDLRRLCLSLQIVLSKSKAKQATHCFWSFTYKLSNSLLIFTLNMERGILSIVLNTRNFWGYSFLQFWSSFTKPKVTIRCRSDLRSGKIVDSGGKHNDDTLNIWQGGFWAQIWGWFARWGAD